MCTRAGRPALMFQLDRHANAWVPCGDAGVVRGSASVIHAQSSRLSSDCSDGPPTATWSWAANLIRGRARQRPRCRLTDMPRRRGSRKRDDTWIAWVAALFAITLIGALIVSAVSAF